MNEMPLNFPVPATTRSFARTTASSSDANLAAFRSCYERFEDCREFAGSQSASPVMAAAADFVLDFDITARRAIGSDIDRYRLFQMHFLNGAGREQCCAKLNLTSWTFASEVRAIQQAVGQAFTSAGLYPLAPYFSEAFSTTERIAA